MKILIAPDSFKGSLSSPEVAAAMAAGTRAVLPEAEPVELPVGDGGEGTLAALVAATGAQMMARRVTGPLGEPVEARWALLDDGRTAFVEMAQASGLSRVPSRKPSGRDVRRATTRGTGELMAAALEIGARRLLVGIGGSATNDGGAGALTALGARFLDKDERDLPPGGEALLRLQRIDLSGMRLPADLEVVVACDVTNPLCGPEGASAIYGPQKGATPDDVALLDAALMHSADVAALTLGRDLRSTPGAGAAGGLGFALVAFLQARLERGIDLVLDAIRFDDHLADARLVISGEGRIDHQTLPFYKTLAGVARRCRHAGVPLLAVVGGILGEVGDYLSAGILGMMPIVPRPMSLEEAMRDAAALTTDATRRALELYMAGAAWASRHGD
ncbi:MAG: glycerate kinase [Armatimonadetes bacterium]|nr:glycerate kinase [Armatimonadota bacterium]